jgi:hypothetical protein
MGTGLAEGLAGSIDKNVTIVGQSPENAVQITPCLHPVYTLFTRKSEG